MPKPLEGTLPAPEPSNLACRRSGSAPATNGEHHHPVALSRSSCRSRYFSRGRADWKRRNVRNSARAPGRRVARARGCSGCGVRAMHECRVVSPRTRTQSVAATRDRPLRVRPCKPDRTDGWLHALPRDQARLARWGHSTPLDAICRARHRPRGAAAAHGAKRNNARPHFTSERTKVDGRITFAIEFGADANLTRGLILEERGVAADVAIVRCRALVASRGTPPCCRRTFLSWFTPGDKS